MDADLINRLSSPKVLVLGDFILDRYIRGNVERISPEAPIQVLKVIDEKDNRLGGAANVAYNLVTLGAKVTILGIIGTDSASKEILHLFKGVKKKWGKHSLDYRGIIIDKNRTTPIKERMVAHDQQMLRVDREMPNDEYFIQSMTERKLMQSFLDNIKSVDVVILSDYNKGILTKTLLSKIILLCRRHKKKVLIGPKGTDFRKYHGATVLAPNRSETEDATGIGITDNQDSYKIAARQMLKKYNLEFVIITLGPKGLYLLDRNGVSAYDPARHRDVYDVTGAGDTVLAALGIAFASKLSYQQALHLANLAAGVVVSKVGTSTVTRDEIIQHHNLVPTQDKLKTLSQLLKALDARKSNKQKIVFTNGCFDLIHQGHIKTLEFARSQGDVLVVGLNSDKSVHRIKGLHRPIIDQHNRALILSSFSSIDYIVIFDESTPLELIRKIRPDVLIKGADWAKDNIVGADVIKKYGGKVVRVPLIPDISTSAIIRKIQEIPKPRARIKSVSDGTSLIEARSVTMKLAAKKHFTL
ncbi:MAG: D-glycero-beta-D-manno-heptose-7-phosphate kinase [Planctomycetota bacterium]